ncbi:MAG TPA: hypothetical protein VHY35_21460 [Stellaceae bacterium]|jgi:hypothetical protein|nr:hypothetical protein [Stellaceae bacterium]
MSGWLARLALTAAACIIALIVMTIALWFLGQALFLELETTKLGPPGAAAIVGAVGLVLAGILGLVARLVSHPRVPRTSTALGTAPAAAADPVSAALAQIGMIAAQQVATKIRTHPYGTIGAALAAGLTVGAVPELRRILTGMLRR